MGVICSHCCHRPAQKTAIVVRKLSSSSTAGNTVICSVCSGLVSSAYSVAGTTGGTWFISSGWNSLSVLFRPVKLSSGSNRNNWCCRMSGLPIITSYGMSSSLTSNWTNASSVFVVCVPLLRKLVSSDVSHVFPEGIHVVSSDVSGFSVAVLHN